MRTVRQQMLCIVSPAGANVGLDVKAVEPALHHALQSTRVVHFAAFAALPARQGSAPGSASSLLFEVVVDEGLRPADAINAIVQAAFVPLWHVYGAHWPGDAQTDRPAWLCRYLQSRASIADGGFVGARDRCVAQIVDEEALLREAVKAARHVTAADRATSGTYASSIAGSVLRQQRFEWALQTWPRSYWRQPRALVKWLATLAVASALSLWLLRAAAGWASRHLWAPLPRSVAACVEATCTHLLGLFPWLGALLLGVLALALLWVLLRFFVPPLRRILPAFTQELSRADAKPVATLYEVLTALAAVAAALVIAALVVLHLAVGFGSTFGAVFAPAASWLHETMSAAWRERAALGWGAAIGAALLAVLARSRHALPATFASRATAGYERIGLWRPHEVARSQLIDPQIEAGEAELARANRVAHMISLVDIRRPLWLFRSSLVFWLRIVTLFGRVVYSEGRLGDAPGIHFAHWHVVQNGERLVFCSNFDGKWGGYLDDFINGASIGLNAIWRCTTLRRRERADGSVVERSFPPTRLGLWRGVKCEQWFKAYARDSMLPHAVRFEAYRSSLADIERATALREALAGARNVVNDDRVMRIIES